MESDFRKIIAIIRKGHLEAVEKRLEDIGIKGLTVTQVKGFGEYANFFTRDWMCAHARISIIARRDATDKIVETILEAAHTGNAGDGIVSVIPVEQVYRIRTKKPAVADEV